MSHIKLFESKQVRALWNHDEQQWYFSVVDTIAVLTESSNPRRYWSDLKIQLSKTDARDLQGERLYCHP